MVVEMTTHMVIVHIHPQQKKVISYLMFLFLSNFHRDGGATKDKVMVGGMNQVHQAGHHFNINNLIFNNMVNPQLTKGLIRWRTLWRNSYKPL